MSVTMSRPRSPSLSYEMMSWIGSRYTFDAFSFMAGLDGRGAIWNLCCQMYPYHFAAEDRMGINTIARIKR